MADYSRLDKTAMVVVDGHETHGVWNTPTWLREKPEDNLIFTFNVDNRYEGRPDLISNQIYNTPFLDWVLIAFNAKFYPNSDSRKILNWPRSGDIVRYPASSIVFPDVT